jgi:enoyl-CoA hydratase
VNYVVTQGELLEKTKTVLKTIISKSPFAISRCINAVNAGVNVQAGYNKEIEAFGACFATEDMKEGTTAFLERRPPVFKGK